MSSSIVRYFNPWKYRRDHAAAQVAALRKRDGDKCTRCRREIRFDVPIGSDQGAKVEQNGAFLTHGRCHAPGLDHTDEVMQRLRPAREAELFAKGRKSKAA